jgi:chromosomal replication initiator protein
MHDGHDANPDEHLAEVWQRAVSTLSQGAKVWVYSAKPLSLHNNIMIVAVQDDLTRAQLESRVRPALEHAISTALQQETRLVVTIEPSLAEALHKQQDTYSPQDDLSTNRQVGASHEGEPDDEDDDSGDEFVPSWAERSSAPPRIGTVAEARLNPRYLFENFVIGSSNRFAHAAAVAVAEAPGKAYNPLVIHGESGLGKTHLLHAIGHYVLNLYPSSRVRYVNSEEFTNDVINAIRENRTAALKRKYREIDVLLVDDIQFLEGKESTQTEFFHTFNALHNENKQIVMTSDRPPKNLTTLEDRLRNRFEWGLTTDVQPPDLETRIAILRKKAANEKLTAPADVLEFIASKVQTNIRELEGALIRATAFANLNGTTVDLQLAQIVLKDLIAEGEEPDITAGMIMAQTAAYSEFSIDDLCSTNRSRNLVLARQIAMYLCRELTDMSLPKIGQEFGNRDHTTVMHADRKIRKLMAEKHAVYNQVTELTARIKQQARQS